MEADKRDGTGRPALIVILAFLTLWAVQGLRSGISAPWWIPAALLVCFAAIAAARAMGFVLRDLLRPEYGAALFVFLAIWVAAGAWVVQGKDAAYYHAHYGILARPILALTLDRVFYCGWFRGLLLMMGFSLVGVVLQRRSWSFRLLHLGVAVVLLGGLVSQFAGMRGYMELRPHRAGDHMVLQENGQFSGRMQALPFSVTLKEFRIDRYPAQPQLKVFRRGGGRFRLQRIVDPRRESRLKLGRVFLEVAAMGQDAAGQKESPRIWADMRLRKQAGNDARTFRLEADTRPVLLPDGNHAVELKTVSPPREYASLLVFRDKEGIREEWVRVNHPVHYGGYRFFQSGYRGGNDPLSGITVKKDPGFPVVVAGILVFLAGLTALALGRRK